MSLFPTGSFVFGIPLRSQTLSEDWNQTSELLRHTIENCLAQTDENVFVVICGHEIPESAQRRFSDCRHVIFIESPLGPPKPGAEPDYLRLDKATKLKQIGVFCGRNWGESGHFMALDADDLVSVDLVAHVRAAAPASGVIFTQGYVWLVNERKLFELDPRNGSESFDQACGSSAAFHFLAADFPDTVEDGMPFAGKQNGYRPFLRIGGHKSWSFTFELIEQAYTTIETFDVIYLRDHGSNLSAVDPHGRVQLSWNKELSGDPRKMTRADVERRDLLRRFGIARFGANAEAAYDGLLGAAPPV